MAEKDYSTPWDLPENWDELTEEERENILDNLLPTNPDFVPEICPNCGHDCHEEGYPCLEENCSCESCTCGTCTPDYVE